MSTSLELAPAEVAYVAAFLARLRSWDETASVRLQVRGAVLGLYGTPPMDVLALVAVPLAGRAAPADGLDVTVSAGRLRDVLGTVTADGSGDDRPRPVRLPDAVTGTAGLAVLPPRQGWQPAESGVAGDVAPLVEAAVARFRAGVPPTGSPHAELAAAAAWDGDGWGGVPVRGLHAALLLGFLAHPGAHVRSATAPGWTRFVTPAGQVFVRAAAGPPRLSLVPTPR